MGGGLNELPDSALDLLSGVRAHLLSAHRITPVLCSSVLIFARNAARGRGPGLEEQHAAERAGPSTDAAGLLCQLCVYDLLRCGQ
jgi:hypothetical protein